MTYLLILNCLSRISLSSSLICNILSFTKILCSIYSLLIFLSNISSPSWNDNSNGSQNDNDSCLVVFKHGGDSETNFIILTDMSLWMTFFSDITVLILIFLESHTILNFQWQDLSTFYWILIHKNKWLAYQ